MGEKAAGKGVGLDVRKNPLAKKKSQALSKNEPVEDQNHNKAELWSGKTK